MLRLDEIKIYEDISDEEVALKAFKKNKLNDNDVLAWEIIKKSIDARDKKDVHYSYSLQIKVKDETKYPKLKKVQEEPQIVVEVKRQSKYAPIIIGAGPAGLFCALTLVENGIAPIIIEQGQCVEERMKAVAKYRETGILDERSNVQFGEGGAGTFSDGKLTTGINSEYINSVLRTFYRFGAPKEITYLAKPHIGTDNLVKILSNMRKYIEDKGGKYYFNTKFIDYQENDGVLKVECENLTLQTDTLVMAIGHSARDTFRMLQKHGVNMKRKNFSVGVRIEHKQEMLNKSQYGTYTRLNLPAAPYKLVYHASNQRTCYSFCNCPGGVVMASASEQGHIVTNGMSEFARDQENGNAALLVNIMASDFAGDDPLAGIEFQDKLEKEAFILGGSNNFAPVQRVEDFHLNRPSTTIGHIIPSYKPGYTLTDLNKLLPEMVAVTLKEALPYFDKKIKGFNDPDAILTAIETRTSSPLTIVRNENMHIDNHYIYPCGEGAGYAGGITSAAIDGIKVALKILNDEK